MTTEFVELFVLVTSHIDGAPLVICLDGKNDIALVIKVCPQEN